MARFSKNALDFSSMSVCVVQCVPLYDWDVVVGELRWQSRVIDNPQDKIHHTQNLEYVKMHRWICILYLYLTSINLFKSQCLMALRVPGRVFVDLASEVCFSETTETTLKMGHMDRSGEVVDFRGN